MKSNKRSKVDFERETDNNSHKKDKVEFCSKNTEKANNDSETSRENQRRCQWRPSRFNVMLQAFFKGLLDAGAVDCSAVPVMLDFTTGSSVKEEQSVFLCIFFAAYYQMFE